VSDVYAELQAAWEYRKRMHHDARREMYKAHQYESKVIRDWRAMQAKEWQEHGNRHFFAAVDRLVPQVEEIEMRGDTCIINHVLVLA
jgi:hypothetical protein